MFIFLCFMPFVRFFFLQPSVTCRKKKDHCSSKDSKGDDGGRIEESDEGRRENTGDKEEPYKEILLG